MLSLMSNVLDFFLEELMIFCNFSMILLISFSLIWHSFFCSYSLLGVTFFKSFSSFFTIEMHFGSSVTKSSREVRAAASSKRNNERRFNEGRNSSVVQEIGGRKNEDEYLPSFQTRMSMFVLVSFDSYWLIFSFFQWSSFLPPAEKCTFSLCHVRNGRHLLNGSEARAFPDEGGSPRKNGLVSILKNFSRYR